MEYLKSGLKSVLGSQEPGEQSGAETVERLVERVITSTLLDDRRDACRALKALSKKYRLEVGAHGMDALRSVLAGDRPDSEIVGYALDTLANICSPQVFAEEERPELGHESLLHVGEQFTEMFMKQADGVALVLSFLEEYDFKVRWPALKLLAALSSNRLRDIQEVILVSPMGVSKLMDLLGDSREVVRNDALLLLIQLTKGNANIQKIVAFENAFDRLFDVITEEGYSDGGIIVEDCLLLMLNLLRNNTSNQNFFKEGNYIHKLAPMFDLPPVSSEDTKWSPQKVANIHCVLQVVRALVSPSNPGQVTSACQRSLRASGIVQSLCKILMVSGVPVNLLTEAICAVGESIRGNTTNQEYFSTVMAPSTPPREAIVVLLMSMVNEKQPFVLRCAVVYCFQCYLFKNEIIQAQLVQTLLPSTADFANVTCGQLLCSGLFSHDSVSNWFSSVCLSHSLAENPAQKEQLLRVLLAATTGNPPVSLLHQATLLLQQCAKVQSKVGLLMLLSTWLSHCPLAVKHFLSIPTAIPYLTTQAGSNERDDNEELVQGLCAFLMGICVLFNNNLVSSYTKESLRHLIGNRVGLENFLSKLSEVSRHEQYSKAAKQPQPRAAEPAELLLDHEFCKLFKVLEGMIVKAVTSAPKGEGLSANSTEAIDNLLQRNDCLATNGERGPGSGGNSGGVLARYKELIRDQDRRLAETQAIVLRLQQDKVKLESQLEDATAQISRLSDEIMLLRAQVSTVSPSDNQDIIAELGKLKIECSSKNGLVKNLEETVLKLQSENTALLSENGRISGSGEAQDLRAQIAKLMSDQDDLLELLADQDKKIGSYKELLTALGEKVDDDEDNSCASDAAGAEQSEKHFVES